MKVGREKVNFGALPLSHAEGQKLESTQQTLQRVEDARDSKLPKTG